MKVEVLLGEPGPRVVVRRHEDELHVSSQRPADQLGNGLELVADVLRRGLVGHAFRHRKDEIRHRERGRAAEEAQGNARKGASQNGF